MGKGTMSQANSQHGSQEQWKKAIQSDVKAGRLFFGQCTTVFTNTAIAP